IKLGDLAIKGTYTVDETKNPKTVDLKFEGMTALGIYEITKDNKVRFCMVDTEDKDKRPKEFKSTATMPTKLVVLKRAETKDATYKHDAGKKPKTIDLTPKEGGRMMEGIYELSGDTLKFCFGDPGKRPTDFKSDAGSENMLMELQRLSAKKEKDKQREVALP